MSAEEILQFWRQERGLGRSVNINCGFLRGIGKTRFLRQLIVQTKTETNDILLIVRNSNIAREYNDLIHNKTISIVQNAQTYRYPFNPNIFVFADEVENADHICADFGLFFIAGVYSVDRQRPTRVSNRNNDPIEAFRHVVEPYQQNNSFFEISSIEQDSTLTPQNLSDNKSKFRFITD